MKTADDTADELPGDDADEVLVAYLDGQLSAEECERVESLLASDATTRQRLQTLDRVWNVLDALPRSTASPSFTRTTVDMAAVRAEKPADTVGVGGRFRPPVWAVASAVGVALGALLTLAVAGAPERRAVRDLPVALHASALDQAGSVGFLQRLATDASDELAAFRTETAREAAAEWREITAANTAQRRDLVAAMSAADQSTANARVAEFQARSPQKQATLRRLSEELAAEPNADELREVAIAYEAMVRRLPASEQLRQRQRDPDDRLRYLSREARDLALEAKLELTSDERRRFREAFEASVADGAFVDLVNEHAENAPMWPLDRFKARPELAPFFLTVFVADPDGRRGGRGGRPMIAERISEQMELVWGEWFKTVEVGLPERVRDELADARDDQRRARLLLRVVRENAEGDLASAFGELKPEEMEEYLLLPRDQFGEALSERMVGGQSPGSLFDERGFRRQGFRNFGPPGDRDRGRDRDGRRSDGPRGDGQRGDGPPGMGPPPFDGPPPPDGPPFDGRPPQGPPPGARFGGPPQG